MIKQELFEPTFYQSYCRKHPQKPIFCVCVSEECQQEHFCCEQCQKVQHNSHKFISIKQNVKQRYQQFVKNQLQSTAKNMMDKFRQQINFLLNNFQENLNLWYHPIDYTCTEVQFLETINHKDSRDHIHQAQCIKNGLLQKSMKEIVGNFKLQIQKFIKKISIQAQLLEYKLVPEKWKFSKDNCHELISINSKTNSVEKKSEVKRLCLAVTEVPMTPFNSEITFALNSQSPFDQFIVLGLANKDFLAKRFYETDLKQGLYGIYQASCNSNNAYSLNCQNPQMHYKQCVGWNFRTGDSITMQMKVKQDRKLLCFRKKKTNQKFQMQIPLYNDGILYPVVGLYGKGDKVTIQSNNF